MEEDTGRKKKKTLLVVQEKFFVVVMDHKQWVNSFWDALARLFYKKTWSNYAIRFDTGESSAEVLCLVLGTELKKYTNGVQRRASKVRGDKENWVCLLLKRERSQVEGEREPNTNFSI